MPSCNVCLDLRSRYPPQTSSPRSSTKRGCPLCVLKKAFIRLDYPNVPDTKIELSIAVKPGIGVKVIARYDGQDLTGDFVNEVGFCTESGMCT